MRYLIMFALLFSIGCADYNNIGQAESGTEKFHIICLEGHSYYQRAVGYIGYFALKVDDNGKPIKCK